MSSDELAEFDTQSPQTAGPSTNKRKRKPESKKANHIFTGMKTNSQQAEKPTEISSDNEPPPRPKARRGKGTSTNVPANGHVNGRSVSSSKGKMKQVQREQDKSERTKKENNVILSVESIDGEKEEEAEDEEEEDIVERKIPPSNTDKGKAIPLTRLQRMYDEAVKQRDEFASQFERLSRLRHTDAESLCLEQKMQYETRLQAQQEYIHELQTSLNQQDSLGISADLQREMNKLTNTLKEKEAALSEKDKAIVRLTDALKIVRADLEMEIENSKRLAARTAPPSISKNSGKLDSRNALVLRLYEELTGILITNVKYDPGKFKDEDAIFSCIQSARNTAASLHFTLKYTTVSDEEEPVKKVVYTPFDLDKESTAFIEQLDFLAKPFTFEREQMQVFSQTLTSHLEGNAGDDNETTRMEE